MRRSLTRAERLRGRANLRRVFTQGAKAEHRGIKLLYIENNLEWNRIAVCPVSRFEDAVSRNREKRLCREAYRRLKHQLKTGYDLAFILYPGEYGILERYRQLDALFQRVGLKR